MKTRLFDLPFLFTTHPLSFICCLKAQCNPFFIVDSWFTEDFQMLLRVTGLKRSLKSLDTQG